MRDAAALAVAKIEAADAANEPLQAALRKWTGDREEMLRYLKWRHSSFRFRMPDAIAELSEWYFKALLPAERELMMQWSRRFVRHG